jgi:HlyD family secretion protein
MKRTAGYLVLVASLVAGVAFYLGRESPVLEPLHQKASAAYATLTAIGANWLRTNGHTATATTQAGFRLARVERGRILATIAATGTVTPVVTVLVGSQVSGQISEILADFNSEVKRGQIVARIDPLPFELAVRQAESELEIARSAVLIQRAGLLRARAEIEHASALLPVADEQITRARMNVDDAGRDLERRRTLLQRGTGAAAEYERAESLLNQAMSQQVTAEAEADGRRAQLRAVEAQLDAIEAQITHAQAQVSRAEVALEQARAELERTIIRAPADGTVIQRTVEEGQTVAASLQAPTLFTIAQDLRDMQVNVSVDETDVGRVRPDQVVQFTVDAFPGRMFEGVVRQIRKAPSTVQNVVTYTVIVSTANPDLLLLPGMTATVQIITEMQENVLRVPEAALRFRPPGVAQAGRTAEAGRVWMMGSNREPVSVSVRVGLSDGHVAALLDGELKDGDGVIVGMDTGRPAAAPSGSAFGL